MPRPSRLAQIALVLLATVWATAAAVASPQSAEQWVTDRIAAGKDADFADFASNPACADELAPKTDAEKRMKPNDLIRLRRDSDQGWAQPCRSISAEFVHSLLKPSTQQNSPLPHDVTIKHAFITGNLDLTNMHLLPALRIEESRIKGDVILTGAHLDHQLSLDKSRIVGNVQADRLHADDGLSMAESHVDQAASFVWATSASYLSLASSLVIGELSLNSAHVTGSVFLRDGTFMSSTDLIALQVGVNLDMTSATFNGELNMGSAHVGGLVDLDYAKFNENADMSTLWVGQFLSLMAVTAHNRLDAGAMHVGSNLLMTCIAIPDTALCQVNDDGSFKSGDFFGRVDLHNTEITGQLALTGSHFHGDVDLHGVHIGTSLFATDGAKFESSVNLDRARIDDSVLFGAAIFSADVNLTSARIARDLRLLDDAGNHVVWDSHARSRLILRNANVESIVDSADAWPEKGALDLDGFIYNHPPEPNIVAPQSERRRSAYWLRWLAKDTNATTQPYTQLATVLATSGDRDTANDVLFEGRERQRDVEWQEGKCAAMPIPSAVDEYSGIELGLLVSPGPLLQEVWDKPRCAGWLGYSVLSYLIGYGIGYRTFLVLVWVAILWGVGVAVLLCARNTRSQGVPWCIAASLDRMLPIVELDKSFGEYLGAGNANPNRPTHGQVVYFWVHALLGWVLGLLLIAAISGITQRS
jgi:hypothetical protein